MKAKIKVDHLPDAPEPTRAIRVNDRDFYLSRFGELKESWRKKNEAEYLKDMKELEELEHEKQKRSGK